MGYLHINNLYKDQRILVFKECWVMEKVHGTSAHISFKIDHTANNPKYSLNIFSGGEKHDRFITIFNQEELLQKFIDNNYPEMTVYGEAYGGKQQGMKDTYGPDIRFIVFDIKISDSWLDVPNMDQVATKLGLEVVPWKRISTDLALLDIERDKPSEVAIRRGMGDNKLREGIIIRPLIEVQTNNSERIIAKHKGDAFRETATPRKVIDPAQFLILQEAEAIANEWVTITRLEHVLQKNPTAIGIEHTGLITKAMTNDVLREAQGEIIESKEARKAIGSRAVKLWKDYLNMQLKSS